MSETVTADRRGRVSGVSVPRDLSDPVFQAFMLLRVGFTVAPILFGLDKFAHVLVNWDVYLAPLLDRLIPGTAHQAMYAVGVIEIMAGLIVALRPKYGSLLVAGWLVGIIVTCCSSRASTTSHCATSACCSRHSPCPGSRVRSTPAR